MAIKQFNHHNQSRRDFLRTVGAAALGGYALGFAAQNGYQISRITSPDDPRLEQYHQFLLNYYGKDLTDPLNVIKEELAKSAGDYETPHAIVVAEKDGEIKAAASGNLLPVGYKGQSNVGVNFLSYLAPEESDNAVTMAAISKLEQILTGIASERDIATPVTITESNNAGFYGKLGFKNLEGVAYNQPPLDWDDNGNPLANPIPLNLMAKLNRDSAYTLGIASQEKGITSLRPDFVENIGKYLFNEWYFPSSEEGTERFYNVDRVNTALLEKFLVSLAGRPAIALR